MSGASFVSDLQRRLGEVVVVDPDVLEGYAVDWTGRFRGSPAALVRARHIEEIVELMELSKSAGFSIVPQGGNTGLVAGTAAPDGSVLLNLGALYRVGDDESPVVGAGASLAAVQEAAARRGRVFGLDMASRDSATVGGAFATNAGGLRACHFGRMDRQVMAVEAVLADGTVVSTLERDAPSGAGTDPVSLLAGSEGTLAVVTAARLRFRPSPGPTMVVLAGFDSASAVVTYLAGAPPVVAAEVFRRAEMELVTGHTGLADPLEACPWYLLVELEERHTGDLADPGRAVAGDDLWAYRDRLTESLSTRGLVHKFDVMVPPRELEGLAVDLAAELAPNDLYVFGHIGMSDFHLNVVPPDPARAVPESADDLVYRAVEEAGGEVAGEHGVGRAKAERARRSSSEGQVRVADSLKRAFDPNGRLNPGAGIGRL